EERRAQVHECERLALRVVSVSAGGAVFIFSVRPPPPEDSSDTAARTPHPQTPPEDPARPAHARSRIARARHGHAVICLGSHDGRANMEHLITRAGAVRAQA